jgi:hypothetical protein
LLRVHSFSPTRCWALVRAGLPQPASDEAFEFLSVEDLLIREPNKTARCATSAATRCATPACWTETSSSSRPTRSSRPAMSSWPSVDGQMTVKYLRKATDGRYFLEAANPAYEPIEPRNSLDVIGLVTGSFRTIKKRR